jgi:hypothetical protein
MRIIHLHKNGLTIITKPKNKYILLQFTALSRFLSLIPIMFAEPHATVLKMLAQCNRWMTLSQHYCMGPF